MKIFLDTADPKLIDKYKNYVEGVTSNPILLRRVNNTPQQFYDANKETFNNIFIQVHSIEEFNKLNVQNKCIYKVPMIKDNISLIKEIKNKGHRVCATTVYDIFQFNLACILKCDFCIVLHHKNDDDNFLKKCVIVKEDKDFKTEIVAASFRTKKEVMDAILIGADWATIPPKVLEDCLNNKQAIIDIKDYMEM
jgi:transaldolase